MRTRALIVAALVILAAPGVARAGAVLSWSVSHQGGHPHITWSIADPGGWAVGFLEIASSPATGSDGYFFLENTVDAEVFYPGQTAGVYLSSFQLAPGTYYAHLALDNPDCWSCDTWWSPAKTFAVPEPPPPDTDGDGVPDLTDTCIWLPNPDQADTDADGLGDPCDPSPLPPIRVERYTAAPVPPRIRWGFIMSMAIVRADTGERIDEAQVSCSATLNGKPLLVRQSRFKYSTATCAWWLGKKTAGKRLRAELVVQANGETIERRFSGKVRR